MVDSLERIVRHMERFISLYKKVERTDDENDEMSDLMSQIAYDILESERKREVLQIVPSSNRRVKLFNCRKVAEEDIICYSWFVWALGRRGIIAYYFPDPYRGPVPLEVDVLEEEIPTIIEKLEKIWQTASVEKLIKEI